MRKSSIFLGWAIALLAYHRQSHQLITPGKNRAWKRVVSITFGLATVCGSLAGPGQTPLDLRFDAGERPDADILAMLPQADGKILVAGEFSWINGANRNGIARLNPDGSLDESFQIGMGVSGTVYALGVQPDGKILVGGAFSNFNGTGQSNLVRLLPGGAIDPAFMAGGGLNSAVRVLALQTNGCVLIGGSFTTVAGQSRPRLARLNADGSLDESFNPGAGANDYPRALTVLADGRILVAGRFTNFNGSAHGGIVRLDVSGAVDATFQTGTGADQQIRALALLPDGRIYIGGRFESYNGTNRSSVARLFPNGGLDLSFDQGNPDSDEVQTLVAEPDGKVWIGGLFQTAGGQPRALLARLNPDGSADPAINVLLDNRSDDEIFALAWQSDGLLLMSGEFRSVDGVARQRLARLKPPELSPMIRIGSPLSVAGPEGAAVLFNVERLGSILPEVSVSYATSNGTAQGGADFSPVSGTLTFAPGETNKTVSIPLLADSVYDLDEWFSLHLSNPQGAALAVPAVWTARIVEASPAIEFMYTSVTETEGRTSYENDRSKACLSLRRTGFPWPQTGSVDYEIIPGSAQSGSDFSGPLLGTVAFSTGCILIPLLNDGIAEPMETLTVRLLSASGAVLTTNNVATLTIVDDDGPVEWDVAEWRASEPAGLVEVRVRRNDNGQLSLTVDYTLTNGTALGGLDFVPAAGTVTFQPGETLKSIFVNLLDDCRLEADEWLSLTLTNARGEAVIGTNQSARLVILDDERPGSFAWSYDRAELGQMNWLAPSPPVATHTDGGLLLGGNDYGGRIFRLGRDGVLDSHFTATNFIPPLPFSSSLEWSSVDQMTSLEDGRILVACRNQIGGPDSLVVSNHVLRLRSNGTLDAGFSLDARVELRQEGARFVVLPDHKVLLTGTAIAPNGATLSAMLVQVHEDGSLDQTFSNALARLQYGETLVTALAALADGRVLVAGSFLLHGTNFNGVARLMADGSLDASFAPANFAGPWQPAYSLPNALVLQINGEVLAAGGFVSVNGVARRGLARLRPDGTLDAAFDPAASLPAGAQTQVSALLLDERERLLVGGPLARALGGPYGHVVRLSSDGLLDPAFQLSANDLSLEPTQLLLASDLKIVVADSSYGLHRLNGDAYPRLSFERPAGGTGWRLATPTITGDAYVLQATTNFLHWTTLESRVADGCAVEFLLPELDNRCFYRVERRPGAPALAPASAR